MKMILDTTCRPEEVEAEVAKATRGEVASIQSSDRACSGIETTRRIVPLGDGRVRLSVFATALNVDHIVGLKGMRAQLFAPLVLRYCRRRTLRLRLK